MLTSLKVSLSIDTLVVGQTATASVSGLDQHSAAIGIGTAAWTSASPGVATVSASGVVTAVAPGRTMLIASADGKQGERPLTIVQAVVSRVSVTPDAVRLARGTTIQLTATALDYNGRALPDRKVDWTTSDATKASVSATGLVTANAPGVATITATGEGVTAATAVTVTGFADLVATVTVGPLVPNLIVGGTVQLSAVLKDAAGVVLTDRAVTWSVIGVPGANVATISSGGLVTALTPGTVIVEAFAEGQYGAITITVKDDLDEKIVVTFAAPVLNELVGDTLRVVVGVNSLHPVVGVVAMVGPERRPLVLSFARVGALGNAYLWIGSIDITDLPTGPYQLQATATDDRGARGAGSTQFQRDTRVGKGGSGSAPKVK